MTVELTEESYTGVVDFDHALRDRLARVVGTVTTARTETPERPGPADAPVLHADAGNDEAGERHAPRHTRHTRQDSGPAEGRGCAPILPTGAGHDAGVLAARVPSAMLFVRNPTGVSHAPAEHAEPDDCLAGVAALAAVLKDLAAG